MTKRIRILVFVWLALLSLLTLTVCASLLPLGLYKPMVSIGIAFIKTVLIFWFYMNLRELSGLVRLTAITGAVTLAILIGLVSTDYLTRSWLKVP